MFVANPGSALFGAGGARPGQDPLLLCESPSSPPAIDVSGIPIFRGGVWLVFKVFGRYALVLSVMSCRFELFRDCEEVVNARKHGLWHCGQCLNVGLLICHRDDWLCVDRDRLVLDDTVIEGCIYTRSDDISLEDRAEVIFAAMGKVIRVFC
jgi:hypothetical protein